MAALALGQVLVDDLGDEVGGAPAVFASGFLSSLMALPSYARAGHLSKRKRGAEAPRFVR